VTRALLDSRGHRHIAEVAPHPFTTIEPNIGPGWYASFQDESRDVVNPLHGWCELKLSGNGPSSSPISESSLARRMLPILVKDVAGLVPGAYKGRGKGNRFLADLCDADVLVHVVDATGQSDQDGNIFHSNDDSKQFSTPSEDAEWIRQELHRWIFHNVKAKWDSVSRKGTKGGMARVLALFSGYQGPLWNVELAAKRAHLDFDQVTKWTAQDLHRLVAHYLSIRFPICLALNKVDSLQEVEPTSSSLSDTSTSNNNKVSPNTSIKKSQRSRPTIDIIYQCQHEARLRGEVAVPVSAKAEFWLQQKLSRKSLPHEESNEYRDEEMRLQRCLSCWGSTGVLEAISEAIKLKPPVLVYPVNDLDSELPIGWTASMTNELSSSGGPPPILRDCLQFKKGSTVDDVFEALKHGALSHASIQGDFIRAEGKAVSKVASSGATNKEPRKHQLKRETVVDETNAIMRIQTNKKSVWQQSR
jgi:ribosome-binding ATPase